jgi:glycosyltransferase involved in cell wall biosynthesis
LSDRILWLGGKNNATDYIHLADYFILSSLYEGMPISLIEAMAAGCLPVCTDVGGIPEMIDPHGVMIVGTEVEMVLEGMETACSLSDQEKKQRTEALKARYEERYSLRRCAEAYFDHFKQLL